MTYLTQIQTLIFYRKKFIFNSACLIWFADVVLFATNESNQSISVCCFRVLFNAEYWFSGDTLDLNKLSKRKFHLVWWPPSATHNRLDSMKCNWLKSISNNCRYAIINWQKVHDINNWLWTHFHLSSITKIYCIYCCFWAYQR